MMRDLGYANCSDNMVQILCSHPILEGTAVKKRISLKTCLKYAVDSSTSGSLNAVATD
jgi:hypothetical protein